MAHIEKYKAAGAGMMLGHYERNYDRAIIRDNIDESLTEYNAKIIIQDNKVRMVKASSVPVMTMADVRARMNAWEERNPDKRSIRKDAVVMADMVLSLPDNVPKKDAMNFFLESAAYFANEVGKENVLGIYIHVDEPNARSHMHFAFTPITEDDRWSYKSMFTRAKYKNLHTGIAEHCEKVLGYKPNVLLDKNDPTKNLSVKPKQIDQARAAILKQVEDEQKMLDDVRDKRDELRKEVSALAAEKESLQCDIRGIKAAIEQLRERIELLRERMREKRSQELERPEPYARRESFASRYDRIMQSRNDPRIHPGLNNRNGNLGRGGRGR